jgi:hypothetical protein
MCSIYVINIGANTNHSSQARSPIFNDDGSFVYVSFCANEEERHRSPYPGEMLPFTNPHKENLETHNDPDWRNLTYGDDCSTPRARALKNVEQSDILLFWGLLWRNSGNCWNDFVSPLKKGWYLLGTLRVEDIIKGRKKVDEVSKSIRHRAQQNIHFSNGVLPDEEFVFLGAKKYSQRFSKAIDLGIDDENGLVYKAFTFADGKLLCCKGEPRWYRSLRACRKMWDLSDSKQCELAEHVRDAIQKDNKSFDMLKDASC